MSKPKTANKTLIKDMNTSVILRTIREKGPVSRADISKLTGLTPATVSANLLHMLEKEIVRETGTGASSGGRKPTLLELNGDAVCTVAVDMGTTQVQSAVVDLFGKVREKWTVPFGSSKKPDDVLRVMEKAVGRAVSACDAGRTLLGIGMGVHGLVDTEEGISLFAPAFQWENIPFRAFFQGRFSLPVRIDNDVRAMALGEKWFGRARELDDFLFLNVGTGIGSGIFTGGRMVYGSSFGAGEIGHVHAVDNGLPCYCGRSGCLHTVASGPALEARAREAAQAGESPLLSRWSEGRPEWIDGKMIHRAAAAGDPFCIRLFEQAGCHLGTVLSVAVNLLNPQMIVVGGGVAGAGRFLLDGMEREIRRLSMRNHTDRLAVTTSGLGKDAGLIGAATLILQHFFQYPNQYILKE